MLDVQAMAAMSGHPEVGSQPGNQETKPKVQTFNPGDPCNGYVDHPFKNRHSKTEKEMLSLLANIGGCV
jgi:hypothetical protein